MQALRLTAFSYELNQNFRGLEPVILTVYFNTVKKILNKESVQLQYQFFHPFGFHRLPENRHRLYPNPSSVAADKFEFFLGGLDDNFIDRLRRAAEYLLGSERI